MVFGAVTKVDKTNIAKFMNYISRFEPEWQAAFAINVARNPQKQSVAFSSKAFADWVQANEDLL
jgi:predicted TIM-barrel enzyme